MSMTIFDPSPLDKSKPVALYYQIAQALRQYIESGMLKPGDAIPTEEELQRSFAVSRGTVRQAVRELANEGFLRVDRPRGTFVTRPKLQETLPELQSFSNQVRKQGLEPTARVLAVAIEPASTYVAQRLGIAQGAPTLRLDRLRGANDEPIAIMYSHVAGWAGLDPGDDYTGSLNALLARRGIRLAGADQTIEAATVTAEQARLLGCRRGWPLLKMDRVTFDGEGRRVEHVVALYRSDRYAYRLRLTASSRESGVIQAVPIAR